MGQISVAKQGRSRQVAVLRHQVLLQKSTYAVRRLLRDLKQIENCTIPTVGVSARPLQNQIMTWHANIRGPENTPYHGAVFHLEIKFPDNYPHNPPTVTLLTPLPEHPNVFNNGTTLCLDMLQTGASSHREYQGWSSAYSIQSVLIQLQSFLFELPHDLDKQLPQIRQRVQTTNQFVCSNPGCRHKGPTSAWPEFNKKETALESFIMVENVAERKQKETCCFHSRLSIKEASLGVGISISRLPRTGQIRSISSTLDLLSIKSYIKDSVRKSVGNAKFTHWFPLYLGHMRQKYVHLGKNALSMICENSTRKFDESQILRVIPKLIITLVVEMMQDATHTSLKALRMLLYFVRYFSLMIQEYPQVGKEIDRRIKSFKESQEKRNKDHCPNMGDLLTFVTVSGQYSFKDVLNEYLQESLDRQVFWMLRDVPELGEVEDQKKPNEKGQEQKKDPQKKKINEFDEKRDEVAFKTTIVSNHILLFFQAFNQKVMQSCGPNKKQKNIPALLKRLDENFCQISDKQQDKLQEICQQIRKVKSFAQFFQWLGLPQMSKPALTEKLKQAVRNSLRKKYHGDDDTILVLPSVPEMIATHQAKYKSYLDFWNGKEFTKTNDNDTEWLNAIVERGQWVRDLVEAGDIFSPETIGEMNDQRAITHFQARTDVKNKDPKFQAIYNEHFYGDTYKLINHSSFKTYKGYTWKQVFLKIDFQAFLLSFAYDPDFKKLYSYLKIVGPHLKSIMLPLLPKQLIKSGYYYLMVILSELTSLQSLQIYAPYNQAAFTSQGIKYLVKGLSNFSQKGGSLQKLSFNTVRISNDLVFYQKFNHIMRLVGENLKCLQYRNVSLPRPIAQSIGRMLSDSKKLTQLDLRDCSIGMNEIKEIADGLMRAKQIETIKLSGNPQMSFGINNILYNLAFSPKISHIDISNIQVNQRYDQTAEALYKLIKITGSLQTLILNESNIIPRLKVEFWKALGENVTLKNLMIDTSPTVRIADLATIGKFVAMNAYKKGQLQVLSMKNAIEGKRQILQFFNSMKISKQQHEVQYGDSSVAHKMEGEDRVCNLICALKELYLSNGAFSVNFNYIQWLKQPDKKLPPLVEFIAKSGLRRLQMSNGRLNKSDADLLGLMLQNENCSLQSLNLKYNDFQKEGTKTLAKNLVKANGKLQSIDISSNKMGVSGAKAIAKMLQTDSHLKFLSLFNNNVDVDGARAIRDALTKNKTLEHLDIGFNRLRKKGIAAISDGIFNNTSTNIRSLGLKYNFINDDSFELIIKKFQESGVPLTRIFIKNNLLSELTLTRMREKFLKQNEGEQEDKQQTFSGALSIDAFDKVKYLDTERLGKTIWISPLNTSITAGVIKKFFEDNKCGIVTDVRIRNGPIIQGKPQINRYAFVQFADAISVLRALKLASKKKSIIQGFRVRIYKAGTRTVNLVKPKKSKKQQSIRVARFGGKTVNTSKARK